MSKTGKEIIKALEKISECLKENPEDICKHSSLKRKCEICERDEDIAELKQAVRELMNENDAMKAWFKANGLVFEKVMEEEEVGE